MQYSIRTLLIATCITAILFAFLPALAIFVGSAVPLMLIILFRRKATNAIQRVARFAVAAVLAFPIYFFSEGLTQVPAMYALNHVSTPKEVTIYNSWILTRNAFYWPYWSWVDSDLERRRLSTFSTFLIWYHNEWEEYSEFLLNVDNSDEEEIDVADVPEEATE